MLRSQTWAASSLLLPHFCPLVFSFSSLLNSFFRLLTWYPLPGPPFLRPFASTSLSSSSLFVFLDWSIPVSITSGCCPCPLTSPRVLLSWVPYLDSASSTLLASLAYTLFLLRLRSWSCYPRSFAFFESKKFLLSLFSCLSWYLLSRRTVFALFTVFLYTIFALFTLTFLSLSIFIISSCPRCFELCLFLSLPILPRYSSLFALYLNPCSISSLFFSCFQGNDYDFSRLCFPSSFIFIICLPHPYFFKLRLSWSFSFLDIHLFFFDHLSSWLSLYMLFITF